MSSSSRSDWPSVAWRRRTRTSRRSVPSCSRRRWSSRPPRSSWGACVVAMRCHRNSVRYSGCSGRKRSTVTYRFRWVGAEAVVVVAAGSNGPRTSPISSNSRTTSSAISTKRYSSSVAATRRSRRWTKHSNVYVSWPAANSRRTSASSVWPRPCASDSRRKVQPVGPHHRAGARAPRVGVSKAHRVAATIRAGPSATWRVRRKRKRVAWSDSPENRTTPSCSVPHSSCSRLRTTCDVPPPGRQRRATRP